MPVTDFIFNPRTVGAPFGPENTFTLSVLMRDSPNFGVHMSEAQTTQFLVALGFSPDIPARAFRFNVPDPDAPIDESNVMSLLQAMALGQQSALLRLIEDDILPDLSPAIQIVRDQIPDAQGD